MAAWAARRSGARTALVVSVLLHLAFISAAILSLPWRGPPADPRSFEVSLVPPVPTPDEEPIRPPLAGPHAPDAAAAPPSRPAATTPAPSLLTAASPVAPPTGGDESEALGKVRSLLRGSVGCTEAAFAHLNEKELDRCAKWRQAHIDPNLQIPAPIAPEKRAWFDAVLAARNSPGRPPLLACGVLIDGIRLKLPKTPPHSLKLGPLPCFVVPPKGPLDDEVDVQPPSRHERSGAYHSFADPSPDSGPTSLRPY